MGSRRAVCVEGFVKLRWAHRYEMGASADIALTVANHDAGVLRSLEHVSSNPHGAFP